MTALQFHHSNPKLIEALAQLQDPARGLTLQEFYFAFEEINLLVLSLSYIYQAAFGEKDDWALMGFVDRFRNSIENLIENVMSFNLRQTQRFKSSSTVGGLDMRVVRNARQMDFGQVEEVEVEEEDEL